MKKTEKPCFYYCDCDESPEDCDMKRGGEGCPFIKSKKWENCDFGKQDNNYKWYRDLTKCPWCGGDLEL